MGLIGVLQMLLRFELEWVAQDKVGRPWLLDFIASDS